MSLKDQISVMQNNLTVCPPMNVPQSNNHASYSAAVKSPPPLRQSTSGQTHPNTLGDNIQKTPIHVQDTISSAPVVKRREQHPGRRPAVAPSKPALIQHCHLSGSRQSLGASSAASNANTDDFQEPSHVLRNNRRKESRRKHILQGSRPSGSIRGAPEPRRDAFIYRVSDETTTDMMRNHIHEMGIDIDSIDCVSNPNARFKSFKVTTILSKFNELFKPEMWPAGICVRKYVRPRQWENTVY